MYLIFADQLDEPRYMLLSRVSFAALHVCRAEWLFGARESLFGHVPGTRSVQYLEA